MEIISTHAYNMPMNSNSVSCEVFFLLFQGYESISQPKKDAFFALCKNLGYLLAYLRYIKAMQCKKGTYISLKNANFFDKSWPWATVHQSIFYKSYNELSLLKYVQVIVRLNIFTIFSFLAKMLSFLLRDDNIFARNENIRKICKRTIT